MAYPQYYAVGAKVGADLVPRPSFPDLTRGPWSVGDVAARDIGGGVMRNRLGNFTETTITLPGVAVAPASFTIRALITAPAAGGPPKMGVRPVGSTRTTSPVANVTGYQWVTVTDAILSGDTGSAVELYLRTPTSGQFGLVAVRVDYSDGLPADYFDGDTADTTDYEFSWDGTSFASPSSATAKIANPAPGGDPDPEPEPAAEVSAAAKTVAAFLGQPADPGLLALAAQAVPIVTEMARAYTRDQGFTGATPNTAIAAVITTASARLVANPEQLDQTIGAVGIRGGFQGWTLAETFVLNRYRKRAQ